MVAYRLSEAAISDILSILVWSFENHGSDAQQRYNELIKAGIRDVAKSPGGLGSVARPELGDRVFSWHLRLSRVHSQAAPVRKPRHVLFYRLDENGIVIGRILHDAMDWQRHIRSESIWQ